MQFKGYDETSAMLPHYSSCFHQEGLHFIGMVETRDPCGRVCNSEVINNCDLILYNKVICETNQQMRYSYEVLNSSEFFPFKQTVSAPNGDVYACW